MNNTNNEMPEHMLEQVPVMPIEGSSWTPSKHSKSGRSLTSTKKATPDAKAKVVDFDDVQAGLSKADLHFAYRDQYVAPNSLSSKRARNNYLDISKLNASHYYQAPEDSKDSDAVQAAEDKAQEDFEEARQAEGYRLLDALYSAGVRIYDIDAGTSFVYVNPLNSPAKIHYSDKGVLVDVVLARLWSDIEELFPRLIRHVSSLVALKKVISFSEIVMKSEIVGVDPNNTSASSLKEVKGVMKSQFNMYDAQAKPSENTQTEVTHEDRIIARFMFRSMRTQIRHLAVSSGNGVTSDIDAIENEFRSEVALWAKSGHSKRSYMPILVGTMGTGKGVMCNSLISLAGAHIMLTNKNLTSTFSQDEEGCTGVFIDEYSITSSEQADHMKVRIDASTWTFEKKNVKARTVDNIMNMVGALNDVEAIALAVGNARRYPTFTMNKFNNGIFDDNQTTVTWATPEEHELLSELKQKAYIVDEHGEIDYESSLSTPVIDEDVRRVANAEGNFPYAFGQLGRLVKSTDEFMGVFIAYAEMLQEWFDPTVKLGSPNSRVETSSDRTLTNAQASVLNLTVEVQTVAARLIMMADNGMAGTGLIGADYISADTLLPNQANGKRLSEKMIHGLTSGIKINGEYWTYHMFNDGAFLIRIDHDAINEMADTTKQWLLDLEQTIGNDATVEANRPMISSDFKAPVADSMVAANDAACIAYGISEDDYDSETGRLSVAGREPMVISQEIAMSICGKAKVPKAFISEFNKISNGVTIRTGKLFPRYRARK